MTKLLNTNWCKQTEKRKTKIKHNETVLNTPIKIKEGVDKKYYIKTSLLLCST